MHISIRLTVDCSNTGALFFEVEDLGVTKCDAMPFGHVLESMNPQSDRSGNPKSHIVRSNFSY
jgi:hypothetical protein